MATTVRLPWKACLLALGLAGPILPAAAVEIDPLGQFLRHNGWLANPGAAPPHAAAHQPDAQPALAAQAPAQAASAPATAPAALAAPPHSSLVLHALGFLGVPYRLGGDSAEEGFDCSGFVQAAFRQVFGKRLPRTSAEQAHATAAIERSELQPGDLVFFNTLGRRYSHVGIYIGAQRFVHSPRSGARIRIENMGVRYWATRFNGARRVPAPLQALHEARSARTPAMLAALASPPDIGQ